MESEGTAGTPTSTPELTVSWCNLSLWIDKKQPGGKPWEKTQYMSQRILNDVSGFVGSGTLMAIMGASGSGKTTLLAALSQRMKVGRVEGEILVNGRPVDKETMNRMSGFVPQQELVVDALTVHEHMVFMAALKMDRRLPAGVRDGRINELLQTLGLSKCQHTRLAALSGGELKRLSLAAQLLTDPPLLFCDEPTTGLDSYNASAVVQLLATLAARGKTVVCTIHQPASGLFENFSRVLLLAAGRMAYLGSVAATTTHFASLGLVCPATYNKAEFLVGQLALVPTMEEQSSRKVRELCDAFEASELGRELVEELTRQKARRGSAGSNEEFLPRQEELLKVRRLTQLYWLSWRSLIEVYRNSTRHFIKFGLFMCIGVIISASFTDLNLDQSGIQSLQGLLYVIVAQTVFTFTYSVSHTFPKEMPILLREIGSGLYKPGPFYISKMLILMPHTLFEPLAFLVLIFYVTGLGGGIARLATLAVPTVLSAFTATAYGCFISALFESVAMASLLSVPLDLIAINFSGIYLQIGSLPAFLAWLPYVSQFYYGVEAISISQWKHIDAIECSSDPNIPCISSGHAVLAKYGYNTSHFYIDIGGLFALYCFSHLLGFIAFCRRSKKQPIY